MCSGNSGKQGNISFLHIIARKWPKQSMWYKKHSESLILLETKHTTYTHTHTKHSIPLVLAEEIDVTHW